MSDGVSSMKLGAEVGDCGGEEEEDEAAVVSTAAGCSTDSAATEGSADALALMNRAAAL